MLIETMEDVISSEDRAMLYVVTTAHVGVTNDRAMLIDVDNDEAICIDNGRAIS